MNHPTQRAARLTNAIVDGKGVPPGRVPGEEQLEAFRAAIALRAGRPAADLPTEEFVTRLRQELAAEVGIQQVPGRQPAISRRRVLAGAVAAAAGVAGAVADRALLQRGVAERAVPQALDLDPAQGQWVAVASDADLADGAAHRFETAGLVGFLAQTGTGLTAVSGVCTHQGCLLRGNDETRRLECPCHMSMFGYDGTLVRSRLRPAPAALPRLEVRRRDGSIEVFVPPPT
jgi:nitrite reductase/ring-hydroxylating ferredoxin subunit